MAEGTEFVPGQPDAIGIVEHGSSGGLPQLEFGTYPGQIFWLVVAFFVLYWLMSRIALPRIGAAIEERADAIANNLDRAEELKRKAQDAEAAYDQALADARARAQEIAAAARAEIQKEVDAATTRADAEISARAAEGEQRIAAIRESAMESVTEVAEEAAIAVIERMMPGIADESTVRSAVRSQLG